MEIYNDFLNIWTLVIPITIYIFLRKSIINTLCLSLLMVLFIYQNVSLEIQLYSLLFVLGNLVPSGSERISEVVMKYLSSIIIAFHIFTNEYSVQSVNNWCFLALVLFILVSVNDIKNKFLAMLVISFPLVAMDSSSSQKIFLMIPFLLLPLLQNKLKRTEFLLMCLGCLVIFVNTGVNNSLPKLLSLLILSSIIISEIKNPKVKLAKT